ncbi:MAG: hypothetical protein AVDCRST_MAG89-3233, partial [uncultured Gemmatimonadetes bacterium]
MKVVDFGSFGTPVPEAYPMSDQTTFAGLAWTQ